ncbi:MAG: Cof-type HAD-IIB family hydrolase [Cardiobacteriaceae bacterium]|nr:Cof-type HAD-IIB family hydrolase [Cardiobacteriaceae bacterium]
MNNWQAIFFDIDDTLCRNGKLLKESREILERLREERPDISLFIATGRSSVMLPRDILDCLKARIFSGLVCMNGRLNFVEEAEISSYPMNKEEVIKIVELCRKYDLAYQQLSKKDIAWSRQINEYENMFLLFPAYRIDANYYKNNEVHQLSVFLDDSRDVEKFKQELKKISYRLAYWQKAGADLLEEGVDKTRGIEDICNKLNINIENTIAFGDGLNDVEMLNTVGLGIAMQDGREEAKRVAKKICDTIENKGIEKVLEEISLFN